MRFSPYVWEKILESKNPDYEFHAYELSNKSTLVEVTLTYPAMDKEASAMVPDDVRMRRLKLAKGGTWYSDDWRPYCCKCSTFARMTRMPYGFKCECCKNDIGWDLIRLTDSDYRGT